MLKIVTFDENLSVEVEINKATTQLTLFSCVSECLLFLFEFHLWFYR